MQFGERPGKIGPQSTHAYFDAHLYYCMVSRRAAAKVITIGRIDGNVRNTLHHDEVACPSGQTVDGAVAESSAPQQSKATAETSAASARSGSKRDAAFLYEQRKRRRNDAQVSLTSVSSIIMDAVRELLVENAAEIDSTKLHCADPLNIFCRRNF